MRIAVSLVLASFAVSPAMAAACGERIAFVHGVIDKDLKVGFIGKDVYAAMSKDLDAATAICQAGQDAQAQLLVSSTQSRHGYPVR